MFTVKIAEWYTISLGVVLMQNQNLLFQNIIFWSNHDAMYKFPKCAVHYHHNR